MRKLRKETAAEVVLPITQFLDMAFQLLFFFMATFNPSPVEGEMDLAPSTENKALGAKNDREIKPEHRPIRVEESFDLSVEVKSETTGYSLTIVEGPVRTNIVAPEKDVGTQLRDIMAKKWKDHKETIDEKAKAIEAKDREEWLKKEYGRKGVKIVPNKDCPWFRVLAVMDVIQKSGFEVVSIGAPSDYRAGGE